MTVSREFFPALFVFDDYLRRLYGDSPGLQYLGHFDGVGGFIDLDAVVEGIEPGTGAYECGVGPDTVPLQESVQTAADLLPFRYHSDSSGGVVGVIVAVDDKTHSDRGKAFL